MFYLYSNRHVGLVNICALLVQISLINKCTSTNFILIKSYFLQHQRYQDFIISSGILYKTDIFRYYLLPNFTALKLTKNMNV